MTDTYRTILLAQFEAALREYTRREEDELNEREREFQGWMNDLDRDAEAIEEFLNG